MNKFHLYFYVLLLLFLYGCGLGNSTSLNPGQKIAYSRHPSQIYIEDSAEVFWGYYPDPFSPPYYPDKHRSGTISFECLLDEKIEIGFLDSQTDSIIYKVTQPQDRKKIFWMWFADSTADTTDFPNEFIKGNSNRSYNLGIIVNNRLKNILPINLVIHAGKYFFISWKSVL